MADAREVVVRWARWGTQNASGFTYDEVRPMPSIHNTPGEVPWRGDCSCWVTQCYKWAGCPDPNGFGYDGYGFTGTLINHGIPLKTEAVKPGDIIVYGPGSGVHTAIIVETGPNPLIGAGFDPLTSSMGHQGDPELVRVSQDGRLPQRYYRFDTMVPDPPDPPPVPHSCAARVGAGQRPKGPPPTLLYRVRGHHNPEEWVLYEDQLLVAGGERRRATRRGGYGILRRNATVRWQRRGGIPPTGIVDARTWHSFGVR